MAFSVPMTMSLSLSGSSPSQWWLQPCSFIRICQCGHALEDIHECWRLSHVGSRSALLLHAGVLDNNAQLSHPVSLHRLVHHCSFADDRVLSDPRCGAAQHWYRHVLALVGWY